VVPAGQVQEVNIDLTVQAPMTLTMNTAPNVSFVDNAAGTTGLAPDGVIGRTYGAPTASDLVFSVIGGLTPYNFSVAAGALPDGITCSQATGTTFVCNSGGAVLPGTSATGTFTVQVEDDFGNGNAAVTSLQLSTDTAGHTEHTINVNDSLTLAVDPAVSPPPDGVQGQTYGNTGEGKTPLTYTATGGIVPLAFTLPQTEAAPSGNGVPDAVTCTVSTDIVTCTSGAAPVSATLGVYDFTVSVDDTANDTTPAGVDSVSENITLNAGLTLTADPTVSPPPGAVQGRTYGDSTSTCIGALPCTPLTYTAAGGSGALNFTLPASEGAPSGNGVPAAVACSLAGNVVTCTTGVSTVTAAPGTYAFTVTVTDTENNATVGSSVSVMESITVFTPLALTPNAVGNAPPTGVQGRTYGDSGSICPGSVPCSALTYTASGGLAPLLLTTPGSVAAPAVDGVPAAVACSSAGAAVTCTSGASTVTAATGNYPFTVTYARTSTTGPPTVGRRAQTFARRSYSWPPRVQACRPTATTHPRHCPVT
jgi:hypothetical protein